MLVNVLHKLMILDIGAFQKSPYSDDLSASQHSRQVANALPNYKQSRCASHCWKSYLVGINSQVTLQFAYVDEGNPRLNGVSQTGWKGPK